VRCVGDGADGRERTGAPTSFARRLTAEAPPEPRERSLETGQEGRMKAKRDG